MENNKALIKDNKINSFIKKINPKNWFSFSSVYNLKNQSLPRRSEIKIKDEEEQKSLLEDCADFFKEVITNTKCDTAYELLGTLHYSIGIADHRLYLRSDKDSLSKREVELYLAKRAYYSAMIQAFEKNISKRGYDVKEYYADRIKDINPNVPDTIYHGTSANVTLDTLGKKDKESGKYYCRDGVTYFTNEKAAEQFTKIGGTDEKGGGSPKILAKYIDEKDCRKVEITDGYVCFTCQDQLKEYCDSGIKYLFSHTPQILDISEYSNFVTERDQAILNTLNRFNLKLPNKDQTLDEYFDSMNINRNLIANTVMWTPRGRDPQAHSEKYEKIKDISYEELFPTIQKSIGTNPENDFTKSLKIDLNKDKKHKMIKTLTKDNRKKEQNQIDNR